MKYTNKHGLPAAFVRAVENDQEKRFWSKVNRLGDEDCWEWTAVRNADGYGRFQLYRKIVSSHRASYLMFCGPIPSGMVVMHTCDNPPCVNPAHLVLGTQLENVRDCAAKNRRANLKGEAHGMAFLTEKIVNAIRDAVASGFSQAEMGRAFGIRKGLVCDLVSRRTWRHI